MDNVASVATLSDIIQKQEKRMKEKLDLTV